MCDGGGVLGCYGVSEMESVDSGTSSASTEPWFCDACRAGVKPVSRNHSAVHMSGLQLPLQSFTRFHYPLAVGETLGRHGS